MLALDMYEHAYHIDFGANAGAYVDAFMGNIHWERIAGALRRRWRAAPSPHTVDDTGRARRCSTPIPTWW